MTPGLIVLGIGDTIGNFVDFWAELTVEHPMRLLLWLIIPVLIAAYVLAIRMRNKRGMRYTNTSMLEVVVGTQSQWRRHLAVALSILSLVALTLAFAKPMTLTGVERERATVVLVIDSSLSMQAEDVEPNRLEAAKTAAKDFIEELPDKYNVAVVSMAGSVSILVPPTLDHQNVSNAIDTIELQESTAIGEGIRTGLRAVKQAPKDPNDPENVAPGRIVLLSDGESTTGQAPQQAATEAGKREIPIYTIAYGTENGYVDLEGERFTVPPNKEQMREIAELSGGETFAADNPGQLKDVYADIGSEVGVVEQRAEVTGVIAGYGLAFALLAVLGAISLAVRWP